MSVANLSVTPTRILILSDTLQYLDGQPVGFCDRKTSISTVGGYAHTLRGPVIVAEFIRQALDDVPTLHEAIGAVAGMMTAVEPELVAASVGIEATLGGWCSAEQRLKAVRVRRMQGMKQPEITVLPVGVHMLPTGKGLDDLLPGEADEALMVRLALAQWKVMHHFSLPMCIGGLMHLTEVTATGARQWKAGEYPDYATMRAQLHPQAAAA